MILCDNINCSDQSHKAAIDNMYGDIINAMKDSADFLTSQPKTRHTQIPGWNDVVKDLHTAARESFLFWRSNRHFILLY